MYPLPETHFSFHSSLPTMYYLLGICSLGNSNRSFKIQLKCKRYTGSSQKNALLNVETTLYWCLCYKTLVDLLPWPWPCWQQRTPLLFVFQCLTDKKQWFLGHILRLLMSLYPHTYLSTYMEGESSTRFTKFHWYPEHWSWSLFLWGDLSKCKW